MPGIFGTFFFSEDKNIPSLIEQQGNILKHYDWYQSFIVSGSQLSAGSISLFEFFKKENNYFENDQYQLLVEGKGIHYKSEIIFNQDVPIARFLLKKYVELGDTFIEDVHGSYNLLIYNKNQNELIIFNDRFGFSYFYYYMDDTVFAFGPELKSFLPYKFFDKSLNYNAIASFFSSNAILGDETFFEKVKLLPPASKIIVSNGKLAIKNYWSVSFDKKPDLSEDEILDIAYKKYDESLKTKLPDNKSAKIIFPLSGGLDSRLLLSLTSKKYNNLLIYTHGDSKCLDYTVAKEVSKTLNLSRSHRLVEIEPNWMATYAEKTVWLNEAQVNFRNAYLLGIAEQVGPGSHTFVNGIIGAHLSMGSLNFFKEDDIRPISDLSTIERRIGDVLGFQYSHPYFKYFLKDEFAVEFQKISKKFSLKEFSKYTMHANFSDQIDMFIGFNLGRRMMGNINLNKYFYYDVLPFLDEELIDLYSIIPSKLKINHFLYQELFRQKFPEMAKIIWTNTRRNLFTEIDKSKVANENLIRMKWSHYLRRISRGRIDISDKNSYIHREKWLRNNRKFKSTVLNMFEEAEGLDIEFLDTNKLKLLLSLHMSGRDYYFDFIAKCYSVIAFHKLFLSGNN